MDCIPDVAPTTRTFSYGADIAIVNLSWRFTFSNSFRTSFVVTQASFYIPGRWATITLNSVTCLSPGRARPKSIVALGSTTDRV